MIAEEMKRRFARYKLGIAPAFFILIVFFFTAIFADYIVPYNPTQINLSSAQLPPFSHAGENTYILGTDMLGRDILSRIIYGARVSLIVALIGVFVAGSIGTLLGVIAGYQGGGNR